MILYSFAFILLSMGAGEVNVCDHNEWSILNMCQNIWYWISDIGHMSQNIWYCLLYKFAITNHSKIMITCLLRLDYLHCMKQNMVLKDCGGIIIIVWQA